MRSTITNGKTREEKGLQNKGGGTMEDKMKKKRSSKKDLRKNEDAVCYDLCDPCRDYYIVDDCGCLQYYVDPCGC